MKRWNGIKHGQDEWNMTLKEELCCDDIFRESKGANMTEGDNFTVYQ